jgi:ABC-type phosphate transport system permease subunit
MRKIVSHNLVFAIEMIVGLITIMAAIVLGKAGWAFFSLYSISAFLKRKKLDEREIQLVLKANTNTLMAMYLSMIIVYFFLPSANWLMALACSFIFFHGLWGLVIFKFG